MKRISARKVIYSFSRKHKPVEHVTTKEKVLLETEDAFGGQVKDENMSIEQLDWTKVNGATGPVFVDEAKPGDTLVVAIEEIRIPDKGVIAVIPNQGALRNKSFSAVVKIIPLHEGQVHFEREIKVKANPMIGTIGVAPLVGEIPTGSLGRHGGNMDVKEVTSRTKLYLPVFVEGALFAAGDLHAVQADGEVCVSAVEVPGEIILSFDIIKGKSVSWPILETQNSYAILACGDSLDEASALAVDAAVEAFMREYNWSFEKAYMFSSLVVDLKVNQVVDPKKGIRANIPKSLMSLESLCHGNS
ncbi:MAG: acetamidase/formamidase family protein [Candidatus Bathyarchaeota archaeon]|nr:acetamidase/formamidase family protein [Candidatus Bathyarchaeota archaeon]MDH5787155.1 acetamidase/formamidase family protein [Candidatus Bathyarchaeota archaeon]